MVIMIFRFHLHFMFNSRGFGVDLGKIRLGTTLATRSEVGFGQILLRNPASVFFGKVLVTAAGGLLLEIPPCVGFGEILAAASFGEISLISDIRA